MRTLLTILALCCTSFAQTTIFPKTTVFPKTTIFGHAAAAGPSLNLATGCNAITSGSACTVTSIPSGHTIAVSVATNNAANTFTVTDGGDTFVQATSVLNSGCGLTGDIWYVLSSGGARTTITVTTSGAGNWFAVVYDISGATAFDTGNHVTSAANPNTPLTTANAVEVLVAAEAANTSVTAVTTPWTQDSTINASGWGHLITSSSGTYSMPFTSGGGSFCGWAAAFK